MTNKIMSIAALAALLSTGASAFNTNTLGEILATSSVDGNYSFTAATNFAGAGAPNLTIDSTIKHGDALIYPYFTQEDGWSSEIYVRNDSNNGVVAKVALYAGKDSAEVKDFNIYLSANDAFRFKIHNDSIDLNEDSVVTSAPLPQDNNIAGEHDAASVKFGDTNPVTIPFTEAKNGYVVIYAMAETNSSAGVTADQHHNHVQMFGEYRELLDQDRAGWRAGFGPGSLANFENGTYKNGINAPLLVTGRTTATPLYSWNDAGQVLTGSVRVMHEEDANSARDMLLPATPMTNFTVGSIMAWTEGETASLADRRLDVNGSMADYALGGLGATSPIYNDSQTFSTGGFYYTFNNATGGSIANNLIFTQPLKRVLVQLGNLDSLWSGPAASATFKTGEEYSFFTACTFWDEKENRYVASGASGLITSPFNGTAGSDGYTKEVEVLGNTELEKGSVFGGTYDSIAGYASCGLTTAAPAIVTEMVGSDVGGNALTNWVYTTER